MKGTWQIFLLIIAQSFAAITVNAQETLNDSAQTFALVVGISGYQNPAIPRLTYADKDATLFADWLQTKPGGSVPANQVKLFTNETATIANVYAALDWLKNEANKNDLVYIYFSGHGDIETRDTISQGYLLAWNSPATNYRNNAISVTDINESANTLTTQNKARVIIISDACHSGKMAGDFYKGRQFTAANLQLVLNNQVRLASCEAHQQAAEGPAWGGGRGVFSYYLLKGLQGQAKANSQGRIPLRSLQDYLDSSFKKDKNLALEKHAQNPVIDGSPLFPMAMVDSITLKTLTADASVQSPKITSSSPGALQSLKTLGPQPLDYFFALAGTAEMDTVLNFKNSMNETVAAVPAKVVDSYIKYLQALKKQQDSLDVVYDFITAIRDSIFKHTDRQDPVKWKKVQPLTDSLWDLMNDKNSQKMALLQKTDGKDVSILATLLKQLQNNKFLVNRFNEKWVQVTHEKSQQMINAYLTGDLAELERRQYYYAGSRSYRSFLPVLDVAIHLAPEANYLHRILKINRSYIAGLIDRLEMTMSTRRDSLLLSALDNQRQALNQEPYAAYIHNEMGNLFLQQKLFDSAAHYYDYALILSPAWAVPWSNKIRLNLGLNKLSEAKEAIRTAESLQPNLAYVNVNAGLVMEKDSNWLAAEAYYLNAVAQNNIHYLPFERLGFLYIHTGRYALADSFFMEARSRKDAFAINEVSFDFGIELGGNPTLTDAEKYKTACTETTVNNMLPWKPLIVLEKAMATLIIHKPNNEPAEQTIKKTIAAMPALPLVHHYLGRKYFLDSNWVMAEQYLSEAIRRYLPDEQLKASWKSQQAELLRKDNHDASALNTDSNCLLIILMNYQYDEPEDYYMLGKAYEKLGKLDDAINTYRLLAAIENRLQMDQAVYKGFNKTSITNEQSMLDLEEQQKLYGIPIRMGGTLKAARILEKLGRFKEAEETLLQQVALNRKAGYARQAEMNKGNFGPNDRSLFNYYWLEINYDLEAETYNFYNRVLGVLPRDAYWYQQAGMFLYNRLSLTYSRIPIEEQKMFYGYSNRYAYPFKGNVEGLTEGVDEEGNYYKAVNNFKLPITGEEIDIDMKAYDPLQTSKTMLTQAIKFSGETLPMLMLMEALTNLEQWMGNAEAAITGYNTLLALQPDSNRIRNAYIILLEYYKRLPDAVTQLDSLHKKEALSREQKTKLAYYLVLSKRAKEGLAMLDSNIPASAEEKNLKTAIYIQHFMQTGQLKKALELYPDSLESIEETKDEFENQKGLPKIFFDNVDYTAARMYALQKQEARALDIIKSLLDSGYTYTHVFRNDPALSQLRKTKKWKKMWDSFTFSEVDKTVDPHGVVLYHPIFYRIPGSKSYEELQGDR